MPTGTYVALESIVLTNAASSVTFFNISQDYRDLVLVIDGTHSATDTVGIRFNGDSSGTYYAVSMEGNGTSATSSSWSAITSAYYGIFYTSQTNAVLQIQDYSASDKHTTFLARTSNAGNIVKAHAGRWANTAAVTSLTLVSYGAQSYASGTTFTLFGIAG